MGWEMLDDMDNRLIVELEKDGRASYEKLAKALNTSISTVKRRLQRLLADDIIKIMAVPDPDKVGYQANAIISIDVKAGKADEVSEILVKNPAIHLIAVSYGRYDIIIYVHFRTSELLFDFIKNDLSQINGILKIETFIVAELKKRIYGWFERQVAIEE